MLILLLNKKIQNVEFIFLITVWQGTRINLKYNVMKEKCM